MGMLQLMIEARRSIGMLPKRRPRRLPRPRGVDGQVRLYGAALLKMVHDMAGQIDARVLDRLESFRPRRLDGPFDDVFAAEMDAIRDEYDREKLIDELEQASSQVGRRVNLSVQDQVSSVLGETFLPPQRFETIRDRFASENAALIKSLRAEHIGKVEKAVSRAFGANTPQADLREEIRKITGVSEGRARIIADDQIHKLQGRMTQQSHAALGIPQYRWRTQRDERVRPGHSEREGQIYAWNDLPFDGHPGEPIMCRCYAEPVVI